LAAINGRSLVGARNVTRPEAIPPPEPDMTPARLFERAIALRGLLRAQQDEADERGAYSAEVHEAFLRAGFYRVTQPRLFGGYEFALGTNYRLIVEISRGHPPPGGACHWEAHTPTSSGRTGRSRRSGNCSAETGILSRRIGWRRWER
jgi:hypothetical protein